MMAEEGSSASRPIMITDSPIRSPIKITTRATEYRFVRTVCSIAQLTSTAVEPYSPLNGVKRASW